MRQTLDRSARGLGLAVWLTALASPAGAATIKNHPFRPVPPHVSGREVREIQAFLAGGPAHWAVTKPPKLPGGLRITTPEGTLKDNSLVNFLAWARDHNPYRFDLRHPKIAPLFLLQDLMARTKGLTATSLGDPLRSSALRVMSSEAFEAPDATFRRAVMPAPVPEPSAVISTLALFGLAGGWWRLRRVDRPRASA